ncbi:MAG: type III secretion system outer membrane ring subunit SctC [Polaromonas sp.]|nr:type III secretion system outer membrane ring subunit SctC [Polaromonas sp.]
MNIYRKTGSLMVAVALSLGITLAQAGDIRWKKENFTYTAKGKNLKEFLREFGVSQGLTVVVAKDVEGSVNGRFDLLPASLIELMAASFGFIWYAEGNVLYISPANDVRSEVLRLSNTSTARFRQALEQLDLPTRRYPIIYDARQGTALVSGPSRYVELVVQTARSIDQTQTQTQTQGGNGIATENAQVRVFPLQYAWAGDFTYTQGGRDQVIPGVASTLSQLHNGNSPVARTSSRTARSRSPAESLRSLGLMSGSSANSLDALRGQKDEPLLQNSAPADRVLPQFVADGRLNAVVVRDLPDRMASHSATIQALDVKPGLVEIEVRIIEINTEALESLGIDWRLRTNRIDIQTGRNLPSLSWGSALSDSAPLIGPNGLQGLLPPPAGVLTTVLGDAGRFLIARVNALAQEGRANLLSSPKVMTLDNVEAVLENLNTFFVRVAGNLDVNLFDISVGTSLRVTPLIVTEGGQKQIKLAIRIEDGALTSQSVDNIPVVRRSTITTQSLLGDGQALLIAGYAQENDTNDQSAVPGLSNVPLVGGLFKYQAKRKTRVERFFLLTPKVVVL